MTEQQLLLLAAVQTICKEDSSFLTHVINAGVAGITTAEREIRQQAADMETVASAMMCLIGQKRVSPQLKNQMGNLALSKLQKYFDENKLFINWESDLVKKEIEGG